MKSFKLNILAISLGVATLVGLVSRLFLPGLIGWGETIIASAASLLICHLGTVYFTEKNKMALVRYIFLAGLAAAFVFFYLQKNQFVYRVPDYKLGQDSIRRETSKLVIIGKQLKPEVKNKISEKLNREKDINGLRRYLGKEPPDIWIDYRDSRNRVILSYVLLVVFLVALFTHLAEEIYLDIRRKQVADVFISYNHRDQSIADVISERLKQKKIKPILYSENPRMGTDIETSIKGWFKNTRVTLALVSRNSLLSGWVGQEILVSLTLEEYTDDRKFLACKVDAISFDAELTDTLTNTLRKELELHDARLTTRTDEKADVQDITFDRERILNLIDQMPRIVQKLRSSIYSDFSAGVDEKELEKLIFTIKSFLDKK